MDGNFTWILLWAVLPTLVYLSVGLYILSLEQKKGPGYKLPALIYFISVPSIIVIIIALNFSMNYETGRFESANKPVGYELYKFLVLKDIIPRSGQSLDEKEESKEDINKDVIKPKINQVSLNQKYNNIINNLKLDEPYSIELNKQGEAGNVSVNITKSKNKFHRDLNDQVADFIETKTNFVFNNKNGYRQEYTIITNDKYPDYKIYSYTTLADTYRYNQNYPKELKNPSNLIPIKTNMLSVVMSTFVNDISVLNFEIPLINIMQSDYVKKLKQLPKKEAAKLFEEFLIEKINYFMSYDGSIDTHLTEEDKSDLIKNALVEFNGDGQKSFRGICLDNHKYNYFVKNNYQNKNCEQLLALRLNDIEFNFIEDIEKLQLRLVAQLDNELEDKFITNEKYYALVIGNNNYEYLEKLDAAENDAVVIADVLKNKYGFEVDLLLNADQETTVDTLFNITDKLKQNDNLLIYYAGHGELDKAENRGYWLPVDASYKKRSKWISNQTIVDRIKATKAKHVLLVADSCFSGTLMRSGTNLQNQKQIDEKYIERLKNKKTRLVITSGGNEPVVDSVGGDHSLFALKFIDTLKNSENVINSQILFENIRRYVVANADQTPERAMVHKTGHDGGDFLFFPK